MIVPEAVRQGIIPGFRLRGVPTGDLMNFDAVDNSEAAVMGRRNLRLSYLNVIDVSAVETDTESSTTPE